MSTTVNDKLNDINEIDQLSIGVGNSAKINEPNVFSKGQVGSIKDITYAENVTLDFSVSNNFVVNLTGNITLDNPINIIPGQSGTIILKQDSDGSRLLSLGTKFMTSKGETVDLSTSPSSVDILIYFVIDTSTILVSSILDIK
jgi:hypothetical protein